MGVRALVEGRTLGTADWLAAAGERLADAECLDAGARHAGALYLLGYVAEMHLKAALWRLLKLPDAADWRELAGRAKAMAGRSLGRVEADGGHSLKYWMLVLLVLLRRDPDADTRELAKAMAGRVQRIHDDWTVELRYSALGVDQFTTQRVRSDVVQLSAGLSQLRS